MDFASTGRLLAGFLVGMLLVLLIPRSSYAYSSIPDASTLGSKLMVEFPALPIGLPDTCITQESQAQIPLIPSDIDMSRLGAQSIDSETGKTGVSTSKPTEPIVSVHYVPPSDTPTPKTNLATFMISPTTQPVPLVTGSEQSIGLNADTLFSLVNQYRVQHSLTPFTKNDTVCSVAEERAPQVAGEVATGHMHAGFYALHLPYWATENIISMRTEEEAFRWWINDPIHHAAIVSDATYSCVACSGNSCSEVFTSFQPK